MYDDIVKWFGDLNEDKNLIQFFDAVLERRDKLDKCLQTPDGGDTLLELIVSSLRI